MKKIGIASDHAGYEMKEFLVGYLQAMGYEVLDFGAHSPESVDYPDYAHPLAEAVEKGEVDAGVALCGSGEGMSMTLNKHQGIRAGLCWDPEIAALIRQHNNATGYRPPGYIERTQEPAAPGLPRTGTSRAPFRPARRPYPPREAQRMGFRGAIWKTFAIFAANCAINRTTYGIQFQGDRSQVAAAVARQQDLPRRDGSLASQILRTRHVPLSVGSRTARRTPPGIHRLGHLLALQAAEGFQRPPPDGLRRLRTARRAVCHPDGAAPGRHHRAEHRPLPRAARQDRILVRLGPRGAHVRPRVLQVDTVGLPRDVRPLLRQPPPAGAPDRRTQGRICRIGHRGGRRRLHPGAALHGRRVELVGRKAPRTGAAELPPGIPRRHDGQLVSETRHGAGQRRGARRTFGARRLSGRAEAHEAVAAPRDGLRPEDARRAGQTPVERLPEGDPAQLDRTLGGRPGLLRHPGLGAQARDFHDPSRHDLRRDVHGHRPGARVGRGADDRGEPRRRGRVHRADEEALGARPHRRHEACKRRSDRVLRHQPLHWARHSDLHLGLRARRVRNGRDHGRAGARLARLRLRPPFRAGDHPGGRGRRPLEGVLRRQIGKSNQLGFPQRNGCKGGNRGDVRGS